PRARAAPARGRALGLLQDPARAAAQAQAVYPALREEVLPRGPRRMTGLPAFFAGDDLLAVLDRLNPRLLAQVDRDPHSPTHRYPARGFWPSRLHDSPSAPLQQASLAFACLARLADAHDLAGCRHLTRAAAPHWRDTAAAINRYTVRAL